jgi:2-amino-4-hydroxy-6-hydroxymethyldihydropteridine diphosphokinase
MTSVFVGIGSNVEPARHVHMACVALAARFGPLACSTVWRSRAVGFDGDGFHNLVVGFDTALDVHALGAALNDIEIQCGRDRSAGRYAPRVIDLDLLLHGDAIIDAPGLTLPRPDILRHAFVLCPLAEIAGARRHPLTGLTYVEHWQRFESEEPPLVALSGPPELEGMPAD